MSRRETRKKREQKSKSFFVLSLSSIENTPNIFKAINIRNLVISTTREKIDRNLKKTRLGKVREKTRVKTSLSNGKKNSKCDAFLR